MKCPRCRGYVYMSDEPTCSTCGYHDWSKTDANRSMYSAGLTAKPGEGLGPYDAATDGVHNLTSLPKRQTFTWQYTYRAPGKRPTAGGMKSIVVEVDYIVQPTPYLRKSKWPCVVMGVRGWAWSPTSHKPQMLIRAAFLESVGRRMAGLRDCLEAQILYEAQELYETKNRHLQRAGKASRKSTT